MTSRKPAGDTVAWTGTETMRKGRQADSARRRQRVLTALDRATASGTGISASGIAAPPASTAHSSTGTATCSKESTLPKQPRHPAGAPQDPR